MGYTVNGVKLGVLIQALEAIPDRGRVVLQGWKHPHSYRGFYEDLAFQKAESVTIQSMLDCARSALGSTFSGWKGGDYTMDEHTSIWLTEGEGETSDDLLGPMLLGFLLGPANVAGG